MKAVLVTLFLVGMVCTPLVAAEHAVAQGASIVTGGVLYSAEKIKYEGEDNDETYTVSTFAFTPTLDYFVSNNLFVGLGAAVAVINVSGSSLTSLGAGPEFGFASGNAQSTAFPYGKVLAVLSRASQEHDKLNTTDLGLAFGVVFTVHQHIGITPEMSIHLINQKETYKNSGYLYSESWEQKSSGTLFKFGIGLSGLLY